MNERSIGSAAEGGVLFDMLTAVAASGGDRPAVSDGELRLSYAGLVDQVDRYAKALLAAGVTRGDRVAMLTAPSSDFWIAFHAAGSIGAIWLGVNPRYQKRDFEHVLTDADPALIVAMSPFDGRDYCAELAAIAPDVPMVAHGEPAAGARSREEFLQAGEAISDADVAAARAAVDPEDIALIVYTSGTTGKPKGAMLSHRAITSSARANAGWMGETALAGAICAAPVNHVGAINNICTNMLAAGGHIVFHPRVDLPAISELSRREKPSYLVSSPTGFAMMLGQPEGMPDRLGALELIVFGGAATSRQVLEKIARPGLRLSNVYGQTETCGIITRTEEDATLEVMAETIGKALPGAELRIADAEGREAALGEPGEIQIRAPYVMSGYFRNPDATAAAFTADGFLRTGDLGTLRPDGNAVFVGRLKEMFKSGGYNVYPVEVEQAICEHPDVTLAAVVSVEHPTFQEVGHAFVEASPETGVTGEALRDFLRERIANYKIPKGFTIEAELPRLPNGKIDKLALAARAAA